MAKELQAKGLQHIRDLKKVADKLHKGLGGCPGLFGECVDAALLQHRIKCIREKNKEIEEDIEIGNPS
jgi:hypothetical protein